MTEEKWAEVVAHIKDNFEVLDHYLEDYKDNLGSAEIYEVQHELGKIRFIYESFPRRVNTHAIYSKRGNSVATVKSDYDFSDVVHSFRIEKYNDKEDNWIELKGDITRIF